MARDPSRLSLLTLVLCAGFLNAQAPPDPGLTLRAGPAFQDALGITHIRYQPYFQGVKVWGSDFVEHRGPGQPGFLAPPSPAIAVPVAPSVTGPEALALAQALLAPKGPYAYPPVVELVLWPITREVPRAPLPRARLSATDLRQELLGHRLAWHVHTALENGSAETAHTDFLLDAHSGALLRRWSSLRSLTEGEPVLGRGLSQFSGTVNLQTTRSGKGFKLLDSTRGHGGTYGGNAVTNLDHGTLSAGGALYRNDDETWGDGANYAGGDTSGRNGQTAAVDAAWGLQCTWDYYRQVHGRDGIDGKGSATHMAVHYSTDYDNAFWSDDCFCMTFGDGSAFKSLEALDVIGHEVSHGVCSSSANLDYSGEAGALNESNSDIHGTLVEFHARGGSGDRIGDQGGNWTIGEDLQTAQFPHPPRYLDKPSKDGSSPDAWSADLADLDVHYGSGPMNRAFYFLSQGAQAEAGDHHSDYLPAGMTGLGNDRAGRIWYRALVAYMSSSTNYAGARKACIRAARDLYGRDGDAEQAVWNAFRAINVGPAWTPDGEHRVTVRITEPAEDVTVADGARIRFLGAAEDTSAGATLTYAWTFGQGAGKSGASAQQVFHNSGSDDLLCTVTLVVSDESGASGAAVRKVTVRPAESPDDSEDPEARGGSRLGGRARSR